MNRLKTDGARINEELRETHAELWLRHQLRLAKRIADDVAGELADGPLVAAVFEQLCFRATSDEAQCHELQ
ncbi:hypothetical protein BIZ92_15150 [Achromobacter xylosoxidans]|uniref:Uncharacterized protein n=1 Tax=Alcaligenes xylosoxydans xylosoxydans TaxID=85698 RepID=A0A1R1JMQ5_ALCXX|nr:hypothetical protein BIZ92_15150 [Achromobacter xylosoxidans]